MADAAPITIRGVTYASRREAARELGISRSHMRKCEKDGTLDLIGYRMPVEVRGTVYPSAKHAAEALGVSVQTVYCAVSRRTTDTLGLGRGNRTARRGGRPKKPIKVGIYSWSSRAALARDIGWPVKRVAKILREGKERSRTELMLAIMRWAKERNNDT